MIFGYNNYFQLVYKLGIYLVYQKAHTFNVKAVSFNVCPRELIKTEVLFCGIVFNLDNQNIQF